MRLILPLRTEPNTFEGVGGGGGAVVLEGADSDELTGAMETIAPVLPYQDSGTDRHQSGQHTALYFPQSPVGFSVSNVSSFSLTANWVAPAGGVHYNEDVSAYQIRFSSTVASMSSFVDFGNATSHGILTNFFAPGNVHPPEPLNGLEYDSQYFVGIVSYDTQQTAGTPRNGSLLVSFSTYTLCPRPTIVTATGSNATEKVTVTFNGSNPLGKSIFYEVAISENPTFPPTGAHTFKTNTTSSSAGNIVFLINDVRNRLLTQYIRVQARNPAVSNWSPYSSVYNYDFTNGSAVLDPIVASNITPTSISLSWTGDVDNKYQAQYSLTSDFGSFTPGPKNFISSQLFSSLTENTTYYFRVITYNFSGALVIGTTPVSSAMTGVSFPSVAVASSNVFIASATYDVSETGVPDNHSYKIELATTPSFASGVSTFTVLTFLASDDSKSTSLGSLIGNTTYYSRVTAINHVGWVSPTTNPGPTIITRPDPVPPVSFKPATLTPTDSESRVKFTWGLGNNTPANTQFKVVLSSASDFALNASTAIVGPGVYEVLFSTNNFQPLISNNTYYAKVEVLDADAGRNQLSASVFASTVTKPIPPQNLQFIVVSTGNVQVGWTGDDSLRPGVHNAAPTQYEAWQGTIGTPLLNKLGPAVFQDANFTFETQGLQPNTTYVFTLITKGIGGWGDGNISVQSTVTWARRPQISFNSASTDTLTFQTALFLTGAQNPVGSLYTYECFLSTDVSFLNVQASSTTSNVFATLGGLQAGALYKARAYITDHAGRQTLFSAPTNGYTFANPPDLIDFTVGDLSTGAVTVNWTHNGNNTDSTYKIYVDSAPIASTGGTSYTHTFPSGGAFDKTIPNSTHSFRVETELLPGNFFQPSAPSAIYSTATLANVPLAVLPSRTLSATRVQLKILNLNNPEYTDFAILLRSTDAVLMNYFNTVVETPRSPPLSGWPFRTRRSPYGENSLRGLNLRADRHTPSQPIIFRWTG
ncbi:MAG: fibronectin type III domain-containing protein [Elusimicrobia bacterium]|nr:fibronectin type III domain-containing protein [Elusimicrobiota bacterium]